MIHKKMTELRTRLDKALEAINAVCSEAFQYNAIRASREAARKAAKAGADYKPSPGSTKHVARGEGIMDSYREVKLQIGMIRGELDNILAETMEVTPYTKPAPGAG